MWGRGEWDRNTDMQEKERETSRMEVKNVKSWFWGF